jgi:hypothetical protein
LRFDSLTTPSFHSWGKLDELVAPWRSEALSTIFRDRCAVPHEGDHFAKAISKWPVKEIRQWMAERDFKTSLVSVHDPLPLPTDSLDSKWQWIFRQIANQKNTHLNIPTPNSSSLHNYWLLETPLWLKFADDVPIWFTPSNYEWSQVDEGVKSWFDSYRSKVCIDSTKLCTFSSFLDDIFLLCLCLLPSPSTLPQRERKRFERLGKVGIVFCWTLCSIVKYVIEMERNNLQELSIDKNPFLNQDEQEVVENDTCMNTRIHKFNKANVIMQTNGMKKVIEFLKYVSTHNWRILSQLTLFIQNAGGISCDENGSIKEKSQLVREDIESWMVSQLAILFANQLCLDYFRMERIFTKNNYNSSHPDYETHVSLILDKISNETEFPSDCAKHAPYQNIVHRITKFGNKNSN